MKKRIFSLVIVFILLFSMSGFAGPYDAYKQTYGDQNWHVKLNGFIDKATALYYDVQNVVKVQLNSLSSLVSNWAVTEDYSVFISQTPTYVSGTVFTVPADVTAKLTTNKLVTIYCGADGLRTSTVKTAVYADNVTTVTLKSQTFVWQVER
jgi:hypothetical protein